MRLKPQYVFVIAVAAVVVMAFLIGSVFGGDGRKAAAKAPPTTAGGPPSVQVAIAPEQLRESQVVMRGRTEAARTVVVRAETAGAVVGHEDDDITSGLYAQAPSPARVRAAVEKLDWREPLAALFERQRS